MIEILSVNVRTNTKKDTCWKHIELHIQIMFIIIELTINKTDGTNISFNNSLKIHFDNRYIIHMREMVMGTIWIC